MRQARTAALDAITDVRHWTYKVPGAAAVLAVLWAVACILFFPRALNVSVQILAVYLTLRFLLIVVFYPIGLWKIRRQELAAAAVKGTGIPLAPGLSVPVHHVVIIPNYKEPEEVLMRTLDRLAMQEDAREAITVVLAMEAGESGAQRKGDRLARQYRNRFARVLVTLHPRYLPGEAVGKGSNEAWAARQAKAELVDRLGIPVGAITLSSCDADSLFHPDYFGTLARMFAADPNRYERIWQAPFRFCNNVWHVPAPVRVLGFLNNMVQISEMANPIAVNLPLSTYSLSLRLAEHVDYWDEAVIAEDWHMFLRSLFATQGRLHLQPLMLPTSGDAVDGPDFLTGIRNAYRQRVRHAWGSTDVGYILQQWPRRPDMPLHRKLLFLGKVVHDHIFFTIAGLLLGIGSVAVFARSGLAGITQPAPGVWSVLFQAANVLTGAGTWAIWAHEHWRSRKTAPGWRPLNLVYDLLTFPLLAVATLILVIAPTLEAQGRQLFGGDLQFSATPKRIPASEKRSYGKE